MSETFFMILIIFATAMVFDELRWQTEQLIIVVRAESLSISDADRSYCNFSILTII